MTDTTSRLASGTDRPMFDFELKAGNGALEVGLADPSPELTGAATTVAAVSTSTSKCTRTPGCFHLDQHLGACSDDPFAGIDESTEWEATQPAVGDAPTSVDTRTCWMPGDQEHDHAMCEDVVADEQALAAEFEPVATGVHNPFVDDAAPLLTVTDVSPSSPVRITGTAADWQGFIVEATDTTVTLADWSRWVMGDNRPVEGKPGETVVLNRTDVTSIRVETEDEDIPVVWPAAEPVFPPAEPEPSISLAAFQQRVAAGEWNTDAVDPAMPNGQADYFPHLLANSPGMVAALNKRGRHVYGGTVPYRTKTNRRMRNRAARNSRKINRGR